VVDVAGPAGVPEVVVDSAVSGVAGGEEELHGEETTAQRECREVDETHLILRPSL
jgi:hypothetical protein